MDSGAIGAVIRDLFCRILSIASVSCEPKIHNGCLHPATVYSKFSIGRSILRVDFTALLQSGGSYYKTSDARRIHRD